MSERGLTMSDKIGKIPAQSWVAVGSIWLVMAVNANAREILNKIAPYIIDEFNLNAFQFGILTSGTLLALAIFAIPLSIWANKGGLGYKRVKRATIMAAIYLTALFLCGFTFITATFGVFLIIHIVKGAFNGAGEAAEVGMMMEWIPKEKAGFLVGLQHTGYPWGSFLGGLIITAVLVMFGDENWRYVFFAFPIIGLVVWIFWNKYSTRENFIKFQNNAKEAGFTTSLGDDVDFKPEPGLFKRILKNPNIVMMFPISFFCLFAWNGIGVWLAPYITYIGGLDASASATVSALYTITGGIGPIVWGLISDKIGTKRAMQICCLWLSAAFLLMLMARFGLVWVIVAQLFMGCALSSVYSLIYKYIAVSSEQGGVTTGNSLSIAGMYLGGSIASLVVGAIIDAGGGYNSIAGYMSALYVLAGVMIIAFLFTTLFTRETNGPRFRKDFAIVSLKSCNLEK